MKTKEFFQNLPSLQNDNIDPEFHVYTTVWMKSRMPEAYNELISSYKTVENEIYAQNEANSANCKDLF
tara:strand:- start:1149 stop:1352 length:204 start_codon:yes stop_codon:yes gene_type:complete